MSTEKKRQKKNERGMFINSNPRMRVSPVAEGVVGQVEVCFVLWKGGGGG